MSVYVSPVKRVPLLTHLCTNAFVESGCTVAEPSVQLTRGGTGERALWAVTEIKKGSPIGEQGYWGRLMVRKPRGDTRTVRLGFDVSVKRGKEERVAHLLLVGDERCCLTYINDPSFGAAKRAGLKPNCKIYQTEQWDMVMRGMP